MKKIVLVLLAVFALVLGSSVPGDAFGGGGHGGGGHFSSGHLGGGRFEGGHFRGGHFRGHGGGGVDFVVGTGFGPWWWDPFYDPYPAPPVVIQSEPEIYLDPQAPEQHYWYYCSAPSGYYPYVKRCPNGWMKVAPAPTP